VADGYILRNCIQQIPLGGRDITSYVQGLLRKNQRNLRLSQSFEIARQIKEQYGYVSLDPEGERFRSFNTKASGKYGTSESWSCNIDEEMYLSGEVLFRPNVLRGSKSRLTALPDLVDSSIQMCPIDLRRELYGNIVLTSGSTRFNGMNSRLQRDVYNLANK
jgi:actin-related protein